MYQQLRTFNHVVSFFVVIYVAKDNETNYRFSSLTSHYHKLVEEFDGRSFSEWSSMCRTGQVSSVKTNQNLRLFNYMCYQKLFLSLDFLEDKNYRRFYAFNP